MSADEPATDDAPARPVKWYRSWPQLQILLIGGIALGGIACMCVAVVLVVAWRR
jgi:hypothetical protein